MFTTLGKLLVLLNAFAAVAVLAWALAAYTTRVDPNEAVDPTGRKLVEVVRQLDKEASVAQLGYAPELARVTAAEARLFQLKGLIDARLQQAETGKFYNIYADPGPGQPDPLNPNAFDRVGRLVWDSAPAREIKGLNGQALKGVEQMTADFAAEVKASNDHIATIEGAVKQLTALNTEIADLDARYTWLYEIAKKHDTEIAVLADLQVNWENRAASLARRRDQLLRRLNELSGTTTGGASASAVPFTLTLPPTK